MPVVPSQSPDASADFYAELNDPNRWLIRPGVPVFKAHQRVDPATGKLISVDLPKLYRIAANMQRLERMGGVPVRLTLGHTEPGKPEVEQPPVAGYYRNARVQNFGPMGEPAVVADEWLDPAVAPRRRNYPYRSAEYYDDTEQITGVALLTRDPYLDLGVVAYTAAGRHATHYSRPGESPAHYHLLLGDVDMFPPFGQPGVPPQYGPAAQPVYPVPTPYAAAPPLVPPYPVQAPAAQQPPQFVAPTPTPYQGGFLPPHVPTQQPHARPAYGPAAPAPVNPWAGYAVPQPAPPVPYAAPGVAQTPYGYPTGQPGYGYTAPPDAGQYRHNIGHQHPGGWNHGIGYGTPPQMWPPTHRPKEKQDEDDEDMKGLYSALNSAAAYVGRYNARNGGAGPHRYDPMGAAPDMGGMPPGMPPPNAAPPAAGLSKCPACSAMIPNSAAICPQCGSPTGAAGGVPPAPAAMGGYGGGMGTVDSPYGRYARTPDLTITGRPVGYQLEMDQLRYQLNQQNSAIQFLAYERDQADTQACAAVIGQLASEGYAVTEYEVGELKRKPPHERAAFVQHVRTVYSKIGTEQLPPLLGDPTPGPAPTAAAGPASKDQMESALKYMAQTGLKDYATALMYVRGGQANPTPYGDARPYPQYPAAYPPAAPHALPNTQGPPYGPGPDPDGAFASAMAQQGYDPSPNGAAPNPYM